MLCQTHTLINATLTGLTPGVTYHYRVGGSNILGVACSEKRTFAILPWIDLADSGPGSLRQAILDAVPGAMIVISNAGTLTLTSGELLIDKDLVIVGPGARLLAISGTNMNRVFNIAGGTDGWVREGLPVERCEYLIAVARLPWPPRVPRSDMALPSQ